MGDATAPYESGARDRLARAIEVENRVKIAGIFVTLALVIVLLVGGAIAVTRNYAVLQDVKDQTTRTACSDRLIADGFAAAGRALAAPPAPNAARDSAVADIIRAADRLSRSDRVCAHGIPAPLEPTPTGQ